MKINNQLKLAAAVAAGIALVGCGSDDDSSLAKAFDCTPDTTQGSRTICVGSAADLSDTSIQDGLLNAVATIETGDTIVLPQGRYNIDAEINFNGLQTASATQVGTVTGVTFKGAGIDKTVFDFTEGSADGFFIENTEDLVMEDFGVYEAANNAIKIVDTDGIILRRMATVWETDYQDTNGAYGLYPVETDNVLIEDCYVKGSADAGVYVGQSQNVIVRGCTAEKNVAGIEIENTINADVYNNTAIGNTGGILVFNLPISNNTRYTQNVRVFDNEVISNNAPNFAASGSSNPAGVHIVPPGTGIILLAAQDVEIFNNTITDNETMGIAITSFLLPDGDIETYADADRYQSILVSGWNPLMKSVYIHDNTITQSTYKPQPGKLEPMFELIIGYASLTQAPIPDIFYDGVGELLANSGQLAGFQGLDAFEGGNGAAGNFNPDDFGMYIYQNNNDSGDNKSDAICVSNNNGATVGSISKNGLDLLKTGGTLQAYVAGGGDDAATISALQAALDAATAEAFELDSDNNPTTYKTHLFADDPDTYACAGTDATIPVQVPTSASKAVVTFDDNTSFSCGVDDSSTAPDVCTES